MTLILGKTTVCVTVFVPGLANFFANVTTLVLVPGINSKAGHFVSASTESTWLGILFTVRCMSCSAVLFIRQFTN